jgi:8-oxo-dGTP pyrophosphatase MutT (NUDIX family)
LGVRACSWNGFGGKVDPTDDSVLSSAVRELKEEAGIDATDMRYRGRIVFGGAPEEVSIDMRLYSCMEWSGQLTAFVPLSGPVLRPSVQT